MERSSKILLIGIAIILVAMQFNAHILRPEQYARYASHQIRMNETKSKGELKYLSKKLQELYGHPEMADKGFPEPFRYGDVPDVWPELLGLEVMVAMPEDSFMKDPVGPYKAAKLGRQYLLMSLGPDGIFSASPEIIQAAMEDGTVEAKANHLWAYSPTNGLESSGDVLLYGVIEPASPAGVVPSATSE